jgi:hypothetical protein
VVPAPHPPGGSVGRCRLSSQSSHRARRKPMRQDAAVEERFELRHGKARRVGLTTLPLWIYLKRS